MRPRKKDRHLPSCMHLRHGGYHLKKGSKWTLLSRDLPAALAEYARLLGVKGSGMSSLIEDALPFVTKGKADTTKNQYEVCARKLQHMLKDFAPEQVSTRVVTRLRRDLSATPNMANRCLTVLRLVFEYALEEDLVESNPCTGVKRLAEKERARLISAEDWEAIRARAPERLQSMMDMAFLTSQRIMDVVSIHRSDLKDDGIYFEQDKTGARLVVRWTAELRAAVEHAKGLGGKINALSLYHTRHGTAPAYRTVYDQWVKACADAGVADTDLRDIRAMSGSAVKRQATAAGMSQQESKHAAQAALGHKNAAMTDRYLREKEVPVVDGPYFKKA